MTKAISQALSCAGGLLLVLASASYAADTPAGAMANPTPDAASNSQPPVVNDPEKVYRIRDSAFFWLHIGKSIQHARDAEIAGNMGQAAELLEHAKISLMRAREAQRAGNVAGLNEGIANLTKALSLPIWLTQGSAAPSPQGVDPQCIDELERQCGQAQPDSGRIQQCFDDKINNFSPMCQEKLKEEKAAIAILENRHHKELTGTFREEAAVRSATDLVREARKNLSKAAGTKYVEIQPQKAAKSN